MCGTAKEVGHRAVCGLAIGACVVVGPVCSVTVGLEPSAVTRAELGEGSSVGPGQQLFSWVHRWGDSQKHFIGSLRPGDLPIIRTRKRSLARW